MSTTVLVTCRCVRREFRKLVGRADRRDSLHTRAKAVLGCRAYGSRESRLYDSENSSMLHISWIQIQAGGPSFSAASDDDCIPLCILHAYRQMRIKAPVKQPKQPMRAELYGYAHGIASGQISAQSSFPCAYAVFVYAHCFSVV